MTKPVFAQDIRDTIEKGQEKILRELRKQTISITEKMDRNKVEIIAWIKSIFSEDKEIRQEIGYQTMVLKAMQDNLAEVKFDEGTDVSSKIEISVGAEIFGTGAKWVLSVNTGEASYSEILRAASMLPGLSAKKQGKIVSRLKKLYHRT